MIRPDFIFNLKPGDLGYDIETYPNFFSAWFIDPVTGQEWYFEASPRRNDIELLCRFIDWCRALGNRWAGFNTIYFDYPVIHFIYKNRNACIGVADIYKKAKSIIDAPFHERFAHVIWDNDQLVPQIDLFKIHHFDNKAKSTSLKVLEFNMRSESVEDLPYEPGTHLTPRQMDNTAIYNKVDVKETLRFRAHSQSHIAMREALSKKFNDNMMNCSDVKIGEKILLHELEKQGVETHVYIDGKRKKLQTERDSINLGSVIFPYVNLQHPEFRSIKEQISAKTITETKGVFEDMVAVVDGLEYKFGTGGLHASLEERIVVSDQLYQIVDIDVASYYPNLGIKNKLYPAHLGEGFCVAYEGIYHTRKEYPKTAPENGAYKLALNGSYGNSNNDYSALKDSQYTMSITINGQLLLVMLVEQMLKIPGLRMIQANTDGITYLCPRQYLDHSRAICQWWEQVTQLELEEVLYKRMFIRDVNSYIAEKEDGSLKRIGAYAYETAAENPATRELPWHKDWSFRVVAKAAEAYLVHGVEIRDFIQSHDDVYDFFGRTKVPRNSRLRWGGKRVPNIVRYYVSTEGAQLEKVMPAAGPVGEYKKANGVPDYIYNQVISEIGWGVWDERIHTKNKSTYEDRTIGIHTGWKVQLCNDLRGVEWYRENRHPADLNYEFYIKEAMKLVNLMRL